MDVRSHGEKENQKRTCEMISKSSTSVNGDHRENAKVVRTCQEKGRRARTKKNVRCTSTQKETERNTENQVERLL